MEIGIEKRRKGGLLNKTWALVNQNHGRRSPVTTTGDYAPSPKPKSRQSRCPDKLHVAPQGCFSVYVGCNKERFVVKMEYVNHPLFKLLLDEAETVYGYATEGPLELPCDVDFFERVLWEMKMEKRDEIARYGCNFAKVNARYQLLNPSPPPKRFTPCQTPLVYPFCVLSQINTLEL